MNYLFAHKILRDAVFATDPQTLSLIVANREIEDFCADCIADCVDPDDLDAIFFEGELAFFKVLHQDECPMVLITLPAPEAVTEAHYVVIAVGDTVRYFTLEATTDVLKDTLSSRNGFFCEWTPDRSHHNYGDCTVHPQRFISRVLSKLRS